MLFNDICFKHFLNIFGYRKLKGIPQNFTKPNVYVIEDMTTSYKPNNNIKQQLFKDEIVLYWQIFGSFYTLSSFKLGGF